MQGNHQTAPPIPPVPSGDSDRELADAGRNVAALIEQPGFEALLRAINDHSDFLHTQLLRSPPLSQVEYADTIAHQRGLAQIEQIARGVVETGKEAQTRLTEEGK